MLVWSSVNESDYNYMVGWQEFLTDTGYHIYDIEEQIYNDQYHYAGTIDRGGCIRSEDWLIDIKTGGIAPYVRLQLSLYAAAYYTGDALANARMGIVHLRAGKKKQYAFKEVQYTEDALAIVAAWQWKHGKKGWIGERDGTDST